MLRESLLFLSKKPFFFPQQAEANAYTDGKSKIRYPGNHFVQNLAISLKIMSGQV